MKRGLLLFALCLGMLGLTAGPAQAWWEIGHRLVAQIALDQLEPGTRTRLLEVLERHPDAHFRRLDLASVWPDVIRPTTASRSTWHYTTNPYFDGVPPHPLELDSQDCLWAIDHNATVLGDPDVSLSRRAVALAWLVHLVGDVHQPMHTTSRFTPELPGGDHGGNLFPLQTGLKGEHSANLHAYWDSGGRDWVGAMSLAELEAGAQELVQSYPRERFGTLLKVQEPRSWALEGHRLVLDFVYAGVRPDQEPSPAYEQYCREICRRRVTLAGYRLADLFERTLGR